MPGPYEAVLFDLFDTLCRLDESVYIEGKRRSARWVGLEPAAYFRAWLDLQERCQRGDVATLADRIRATCRALGREIDSETLGAILRCEEEALFRCAALHPDVLPILRRLRGIPGLRLGLVSNASSPARRLAEFLGLAPFFDALIFSFEVGSVKPEPGIYLAACRTLSVSPSGCLFVGDGNGGELEGAMALGMTAVRIERAEVMEAYRKNPSLRWDFSVRDLRELAELPWKRHSSVEPSTS